MKTASKRPPKQGMLYTEMEQPDLPDDLRGMAVTDGHSLLPFQMFKDRAVSWNGLIVAAYLDQLLFGGGSACWQTDKTIAKECGICLRSAQQAVEELRTKGFLHVDRQKFRGRVRRILFLLWKVPETVPKLDRESAQPCAKNSARPCAKTAAGNASEGANLCASNAHDHALPYPISNSPVLNSPNSTGTGRTYAHTRGRPPDPPPPPPPAEPPVAGSVQVISTDQPTPEQIAEWEALVRRAPRSPAGHKARLALSAVRNDRAGAGTSPPAARAAPGPPQQSTGNPRPGTTSTRADELADALADPDRADSVQALVRFLANRTDAAKPETLGFWEKAFTAARAGELPLGPVKEAVRDSLKGHVRRKPNHLSRSLANLFRRAKTTAAGPTVASSPGDGRNRQTHAPGHLHCNMNRSHDNVDKPG